MSSPPSEKTIRIQQDRPESDRMFKKASRVTTLSSLPNRRQSWTTKPAFYCCIGGLMISLATLTFLTVVTILVLVAIDFNRDK